MTQRRLLLLASVATLVGAFTSVLEAHGVSGKDAVFLQGLDGRAIVPLMYLGAKHMVTGYDHLLFLVGVIFFLYRPKDVLLYVMDEWGQDLRSQGHVLEEDDTWAGGKGDYPRYVLRLAGGGLCQLHFTGEYPRALYLSISKGFRNGQQFSDARQVQFELPITLDPNVLLISLLENLRSVTV